MKSGWNIRDLNYFLIGNGDGPDPWLGGLQAVPVRGGPWAGPQWLAARVATGRARWGTIGGPLTGAQTMARRWCTGGGALVGMIEEGRRGG
jgi:hypothetical protein